MTYPASAVVLVAGILVLFLALFHIAAIRMAERSAWFGKVSFSTSSMHLFALPSSFTRILFGIVSVAFPKDLTTSELGVTLCLGMSGYFVLQGWAQLRSPELRDIGAKMWPLFYFAIAGCYGAAFLLGVADVI